MDEHIGHLPRRRAIQSAAAAGASLALGGAHARADETSPVPAPGRPYDFDFLAGEWRIRHRRLMPGTAEWDAFDGEATCWTVLGSVGELRIPARDFSGMGLRLLDLETKVWGSCGVNAKSGTLGAAGRTGRFVAGEGIFDARDSGDGKPVTYRGAWDRIVPGKTHRW